MEVKNPTILPDEPTKKYIMLDISAIDNQQRRYDIEMQALKYAFYPQRIVYYLCKMYAEQLASGEQYGRLTPVIGVHFLNYDQYPEHSDFHFCFAFRDVRYLTLRLTDDLSLHLFELPKFERTVTTTMSETNMHEWLHFLNHAQDETDPAIRQAFRALDRLSADAEARRLAWMREKALKDQVSALAEARDEGLREGLEKGELIGEIRLAQYQLELPLSSPEALARQTPEALQSLYHDLRQRLRQRTSRETQG